MEVALYHPDFGYYHRPRDPFGRDGDYFTAEQIQPVFGILIAARIRQLREELGNPPDFAVVELGAGRAEMAPAFAEFSYLPVDVAAGALPAKFSGIVFSNEFFDALPADAAVRRGSTFREMRVDWREERFLWVEGPPLSGPGAEYAERYLATVEEGAWVEIHLAALRWMERIAARLDRGYVLSIDYGYTTRELARHPRGTLMSYRRHAASEDILADPGDRDITAHVPFTALQDHGARLGLETVRFERLARTLIAAGEPGSFAEALAPDAAASGLQRSLQLKTLLFGMGETFRTLLQRKTGGK
jgi:SAM-dependent MidA family methyltransferase